MSMTEKYKTHLSFQLLSHIGVIVGRVQLFCISRMDSTVVSKSLLLSFLLILHQVAAQLAGCATVNCPAEGADWDCPVGNVTYMALGIASFESDISPTKPLTWTLAHSEQPIAGSDQYLWTREYFLGTPASISLRNVSSYSGCAVFFQGMTRKLQFNNTDPHFSEGTCSDVLTAECVSDLLSQAHDETISLSSTPTAFNETATCLRLQSVLQNGVPKSCSQIAHNSWGELVAKGQTSVFVSYAVYANTLCRTHWC